MTAPASRLIAGVPLDNGSPLMTRVTGSDFLPLQTPKLLLYSVDLRLCKIPRRLTEMKRSRYSIKPNAGKGLSGFIANFSVVGEFDPADWIQTDVEGNGFLAAGSTTCQ